MKRLSDDRLGRRLSEEPNPRPRGEGLNELSHVDSIIFNNRFPLSVSPREPFSEMDETIENLLQSPSVSVSETDSRRYSSAFTPIRKRDHEISTSPVCSCSECVNCRVYQFESPFGLVLQLNHLPPFLGILP